MSAMTPVNPELAKMVRTWANTYTLHGNVPLPEREPDPIFIAPRNRRERRIARAQAKRAPSPSRRTCRK